MRQAGHPPTHRQQHMGHAGQAPTCRLDLWKGSKKPEVTEVMCWRSAGTGAPTNASPTPRKRWHHSTTCGSSRGSSSSRWEAAALAVAVAAAAAAAVAGRWEAVAGGVRQ